MRLTIVSLFCLMQILTGPAAAAAADAFVGVVKTIEGGAVITRNGETIAVGTGMEIQRADLRIISVRNGYWLSTTSRNSSTLQ